MTSESVAFASLIGIRTLGCADLALAVGEDEHGVAVGVEAVVVGNGGLVEVFEAVQAGKKIVWMVEAGGDQGEQCAAREVEVGHQAVGETECEGGLDEQLCVGGKALIGIEVGQRIGE